MEKPRVRTFLLVGAVVVVLVLFGMSVAIGRAITVPPRECSDICHGDVWAWSPVRCECSTTAGL